jgi:hypothetical protein
MSREQRQRELVRQVRNMDDDLLRSEIARIFGAWCWISGEPEVKEYYALLLEEAERRKSRGNGQ